MRYLNVTTCSTVFASVLTMMSSVAFSGELAAPTGPVILEVTGNIENTNGPGRASFDAAMLKELGLVEVVTETPWTDGTQIFVGPLAKDVLKAVGASGASVSAIAYNDYAVEIPISDFEELDPILATELNGTRMRIRDRGPVWLIYPWGDNPQLRNELYYSRSIWQLKELTVSE